MKFPAIRGVIARRILVNYRVDPDRIAQILPAPFRPRILHGFGLVGICLIRLQNIRPTFLPSWLGISSENAAYRTAVEWLDGDILREGVFVRRRDTNSRLNAWAGGRVFPGEHNLAAFQTHESADQFSIELRSGRDHLLVRAHRAREMPASIFRSLDEASQFFQAGSLGYSCTCDPHAFHGLELRTLEWKIEPLHLDEVRSSYFDDASIFPPGSIVLDSAFLMRNIQHEWRGHPTLTVRPRQIASPSVA